jgi:hypothetical protein
VNQRTASPPGEAAIDAIASAAAPPSYLNWKLCMAGAPRTATVEAAIYTWILGEYETGPLKFINTLADPRHQTSLRPGIVLRFSCYWPPRGYARVAGTKDGHYHGGDYLDEIAALTSLALGIRAQAGPITREFWDGGDPLGHPTILSGMKPIPTLGQSVGDLMLPRIREPANLTNLSMLGKIPRLTRDVAGAVIKCARSYQSALWFADSNPEMSWLFLVSAIETAAGYWAKKNFKGHDAGLADDVKSVLEEHGCPISVHAPLANLLREHTKATKKFTAFLVNFLPEPPPEDKRPHENVRVKYVAGELEEDFKAIYGYRSRALHNSIPFPYPMCVPPNAQIKEERNFSLGASARGATWDFTKYRPLMFHTFEHIARGALQQWIRTL